MKRPMAIEFSETILTNTYKVIETTYLRSFSNRLEANEAANIATKLFELSDEDRDEIVKIFGESIYENGESHCEEYAELVIEYLEESEYFEE